MKLRLREREVSRWMGAAPEVRQIAAILIGLEAWPLGLPLESRAVLLRLW